MNPLVTVIIPVYNVEKYLAKCVESVLTQTYTNLEIILVDDGSPDTCPKICDELAESDGRIRVIHKKNGGLSSARNAGLAITKGELIAFVDSDDEIEKEFIERLYNRLISDGSDIAISSVRILDENREVLMDYPVGNGSADREEFWHIYYKGYTVPYIVACSKLYRRKLFEHTRFKVGKIHEDEFILKSIIDNCNIISFVDDCRYLYFSREGSIMSKKYNVKRLDGAEAILRRCFDFLHDKRLNDNNFYAECCTSSARAILLRGYQELDFENPENRKRYYHLRDIYKKAYRRVYRYPRFTKKYILNTAFFCNEKLAQVIAVVKVLHMKFVQNVKGAAK